MKTATDQILLFLKTRGPGTTQAVAVLLGVSRQAARVHLEKLTAQGLLASDTVPEGVGRPKQTWRLTNQGHSRFPDSHAQMTVELIEAIREEFGAPGLERLVVRREAVTAKSYEQALAGAAGLEARLERLSRIRVQEGYMASWHPDRRPLPDLRRRHRLSGILPIRT
jgi:predicted ArsR family transcriptional regulator